MTVSPEKELIDVIDPDGMSVVATALRSEVHRLGLWHRTVHVWVLNGKKELLLQKRSKSKESFPGLWDISAAGHITSGDASKNAALRELMEELGIQAGEDELTLLFTITGHYESPSKHFVDNEFSDVYLLRADIPIDKVAVDGDEVDEVKYMSVEELKRELEMHPALYVPHHEAYGRLFGYLQ